MFFSKETNLFGVTDDEILNFNVGDYSSTMSSNHSQCKLPALDANKSETSKVKGVSNTLDNFLHKFDFKPRAEVVTDTSLEAIVKGASKFKDEGQQSVLVPKASENDLTINGNSNHSVVDSCDKNEPVSAEKDISFDVFFEDDEDFMKICDDPQHKEAESLKSHKLYNEPSGCSTSSSSNGSVDMLPTKPPLNCNLKKTLADECVEKKLKNSNDFWALASPCISANPTEILSSKELLDFSSETVPFLTEFMGENSSDSCEVSSPRVTAKPRGDLISQNAKAMTLLRKDDLEFEVAHSKSPAPVNSTWLAKLSKNHSSHKARKRKFPGPAGLLPDLPPRSPIVPKQHDYSLELNATENIDDQEFLYSQSSEDDFLSAPWTNMTRDLSNHNNLALLKKFNIKSVRKQASKKKLPKYVEVPFFCVLLKSFILKDSEVITIFKDETGEISGKIHQEVIDKYRDSMKVGSVIVLKKAVFLLDQLGIKLANIVSIYDPNGNKICINNWNDAVLCKNIHHSSSKPPQCPDGTSASKDESQEYIVELMEESLFEDDFNDIVSTLDENSFLA